MNPSLSYFAKARWFKVGEGDDAFIVPAFEHQEDARLAHKQMRTTNVAQRNHCVHALPGKWRRSPPACYLDLINAEIHGLEDEGVIINPQPVASFQAISDSFAKVKFRSLPRGRQ